MNQQDFLNIIEDYKNVIRAWKLRADVQDGRATGWKPNSDSILKMENRPLNIGAGLSTTGWCVSASQALLTDPVFQELLKYRFAKAKLISIDIKEQYYGHVYSGNQNKWHTAILVQDSDFTFVIDITCSQFGEKFFGGKDFWDFATWQETFRSSRCKHILTDFNDNEVEFVPVLNDLKVFNKDFLYSEVFNNLHNQTNLSNQDRNLLTDFLVNQLIPFNNKILTHTLTVNDYEFLKQINDILSVLPYDSQNKLYSVLEFNSKSAAKNWLTNFLNNQCKIDMYLMTFSTLNNACLVQNIDHNELNSKKQTGKFYVIIELNNQYGICLKDFFKYANLLIPHNTALEVKTVINGVIKYDYDELLNKGINDDEINNEIQKLSENINDIDKYNTSWLIVNSI